MSENNDSEELREGSVAAGENPDSDGSISLEPTVSAAGHGVEGNVFVEPVDQVASLMELFSEFIFLRCWFKWMASDLSLKVKISLF